MYDLLIIIDVVPLLSVTIDIVGQNYKKGATVIYQKKGQYPLIQSIWLKSIQSCCQKYSLFLGPSTLSVW